MALADLLCIHQFIAQSQKLPPYVMQTTFKRYLHPHTMGYFPDFHSILLLQFTSILQTATYSLIISQPSAKKQIPALSLHRSEYNLTSHRC